jgi:tetratricopeptide (TPR) repeat protein
MIVLPIGVLLTPWLGVQYDVYRARIALQRFRTDSALEWLKAAQKWEPDNAETHFLVARVCRRKGQFDDMEEHLEEARRLGFPAARLERERRLAVAQTGRVHEVQRYLPGMLTAPDDDGPEICASYVSGFCLSFDFGSATPLLDAWSADYPDEPEPHFRRGNLWHAQNEWGSAVEAYGKCLDLDPTRTSARLGLAECLLKIRECEKAVPHFHRCLKEAPENLEAWLGLGTCLLSLGRNEEARTALHHVLDASPENFEARRQLGELELQLGRPQEALNWVQPLAEKWPEDTNVSMIMAQALREIGKVAEAQTYFQAVRRSEKVLERLGRLVDQINRDPTDVAVRYEIGSILLRHRSREDGVGWLQSLLQYDPNHPGAHEALADYYTKVGNEPMAEQHRRFVDRLESPRGP